jgi:hypothetical protein
MHRQYTGATLDWDSSGPVSNALPKTNLSAAAETSSYWLALHGQTPNS